MAGDWIKMRVNLDTDPRVWQISQQLRIGVSEVVFCLYKTTCWFQVHGKYGVAECNPNVLDAFLKQNGFAEALCEVDWMRYENGNSFLRGFCTVSSTRKSFGRKVRSIVLKGGCANCGTTEALQIDHKIPVSRGGTSDIENLQPLCARCNILKGTKTMEEFQNDRRP